MRAFLREPKATRQPPSVKSATPARSSFMNGNQAMRSSSEADEAGVKRGSTTAEAARFGHDFGRMAVHAATPADSRERAAEASRHRLPAPSIRVSRFAPPNASNAGPQDKTRAKPESDKSTAPSTEDQDQTASLSSLAATASGVAITVEPVGAYSSDEFPDGFRWTQTITTNANKGGPLLTTPVDYTDPKPNDDAKPFYWTDAEEVQHKGTFSDTPSRKPRSSGTVVWDAILSLNGVNGKNVTRFDSLGYGFSVDSGGKVALHGATTPADLSNHLSTLRGDFPDWTFK